MNRRRVSLCLSVLVLSAVSSYAQAEADRFYQAIRDNDLSTIGTLLKSYEVNLKDKRGTTPLMYAAAVGSPAAVKVLLAAGGDPNAKNSFDATALMWCTTNAEKTRMLLDKGADVNAK